MSNYLPMSIGKANEKLVKKLAILYGFAWVAALLLVTLDSFESIAGAASSFFKLSIPSLSYAPQSTRHAFVNFFGLTAFLAPLAVAYLIAGDPLRDRFSYAIRERHSISLKRIFFLYLIAVPTIVSILYFSLAATTLARISQPVTAGARLIHSMAESPIFLVLLAPIVSLGLILLAYVASVPLIGPFKKPTEK